MSEILTIDSTLAKFDKTIAPQPDPFDIGFIEKKKVQILVFRQILKNANIYTENAWSSIRALWRIRKKYEKVFGETFLQKIAKVSNKYYWKMAAPGFPSLASEKMHQYALSRILPENRKQGLRSLIFAITKKCALNCEHCVEWHNLNKKETLCVSDIINIVHKYQDYGTTQIMFSGGEPMLRYNDLIHVLEASYNTTDFWIITSGLGVNEKKMERLKKAGLSGLMVSLDHYDPIFHDQFRGFESSYKRALQAVIAANKTGLVSALSICVNKNFLSKNFLIEYMELAKKLGVSFVQILEPRASGRYENQSIEISDKHKRMIEEIYLSYNTLKEYKSYPIVIYHGHHQRKVGCFGGGNEFMYIDTDGDAHICPFCTNKIISTLQSDPEVTIQALSQKNCGGFAKMADQVLV